MIAFLSGQLREILDKSVILNCNGVGYEVFVPSNILGSVRRGEEVEFYIHTHVREDQLCLYGFSSFTGRNFFKQLISVSGIGPKTGLEMLSQPVNELKSAIVSEDAAFIARTPGIGKKTAERVILDLKGKIDAIEIVSGTGSGMGMTVRDEVVIALEGLGYRRQQVLRVLNVVPEEIESSEDIITYFLKNA